MKKLSVFCGLLFIFSINTIFAQMPSPKQSQTLEAGCTIPLRIDVKRNMSGDVTGRILCEQTSPALKKLIKRVTWDIANGKIPAYQVENEPNVQITDFRKVIAENCPSENDEKLMISLTEYLVVKHTFTSEKFKETNLVKRNCEQIHLVWSDPKGEMRDRVIAAVNVSDLKGRRYKLKINHKRYTPADFLSNQAYYYYPYNIATGETNEYLWTLPEAFWVKTLIENGNFDKIKEGLKAIREEGEVKE